jgi:hypothetical protein
MSVLKKPATTSKAPVVAPKPVVVPKPAVTIAAPKVATPAPAAKTAAPAPAAPKAAVVPPKVAAVVAPKNTNPASVTGQITFGKQADTKAQLPILIVLGAVAVLLFRGGLFKTGSRRR